MSCGKRLAKRSIVGTRVSAPFDGLYYSGVIQAIKTSDFDIRDALYSVLFDNKLNGRKISLDFRANQLIGPGFETINNLSLKSGQKVFITYNGREVSGFVEKHNVSTDEVLLTIDLSSNQTSGHNSLINHAIQVRRPLDELRLAQSRKSARLLELDTDYSRLASDGQTEHIRRRTSSMSSTISSSSMSSHIDVPVVQNGRKRRTSNCSDLDDNTNMDDCMAAMVLMSLSCSPTSPALPRTPSKNERRILFQCTWPGCAHTCQHCHQMEKHVRTHLGRTDLNEQSSDHEEEFYYTEMEIDDSSHGSSDSSSSTAPHSPSVSHDGSQQSDSQSPIPSPQIFFTSSSAPVWSHLEDHEYQKPCEESEMKINLIELTADSNGTSNDNKPIFSTPINIPNITTYSKQYAKSAPTVALQSPRANFKYMRLNTNFKSGTTLLQSPNKTSPTKRGRGESRKCRKVYGMDNRDSWCTQCKWKKACSRFTD